MRPGIAERERVPPAGSPGGGCQTSAVVFPGGTDRAGTVRPETSASLVVFCSQAFRAVRAVGYWSK
ncbi:hypothetical protein GCM10020000_72190 [Streptomyces olivoverticillatus]